VAVMQVPALSMGKLQRFPAAPREVNKAQFVLKYVLHEVTQKLVPSVFAAQAPHVTL